MKTFAKINFICDIVLAVICFGVAIGMDDWFIAGILGGCCAALAAIIVGWFIYAFAELLENTKEINHSLKLAYADKLSEEMMKEKKLEQERKEQAEKRRKQEQERQWAEAERIKTEKLAKLERINNYWKNHPEEQAALLAKQTEARNKLKEMGKLAGKQRAALEDVIRAIDEELTKDRNDE